MHIMFRQYAQQMGMQNVRAILPEQIDLLLNTSQMDAVNQIIKENIGITNDRVITDNSKVGQINALRSLYHVHYIEMSPIPSQLEEKRVFSFSASDRNTGRMTTDFKRISDNNLIPDYMFLVDFSLNYKKVINGQGYNGKTGVSIKGAYNVLTPNGCISGSKEYLFKNVSITDPVTVETYVTSLEDFDNLTFVVDSASGEKKLKCTSAGYTDYYLGVEGTHSADTSYGGKHYVLTQSFTDGDEDYNGGTLYNPLVINSDIRTSEYVAPTFENDGLETNYFPVRIIDDAYLSDTLNDFVLKNRIRTPIIVTYNSNNVKGNIFDLYIDKFTKTPNNRYVLEGNLIPYKLRMSYISKPTPIFFGEDLGEPNKDCTLPEYMHIDIVKHAVDLYRMALSGSIMSAQQQEKQASQENMRNNYRNEGNAQ